MFVNLDLEAHACNVGEAFERIYLQVREQLRATEHKDGQALLLWHQVANFLVLLQLRHDMRHLHSNVGTGRHSYTCPLSFSRPRYHINCIYSGILLD